MLLDPNTNDSPQLDPDTADIPPLVVDPYRPPNTTMVPTLRKYAANQHQQQTDRSLSSALDTRECAPPTRRQRRDATPLLPPSLDIPLLPPREEAPAVLPTPQRPAPNDITAAPLAPFQPLPTTPTTRHRLAAVIRSYGTPSFIPLHSPHTAADTANLPRIPAHLLTTPTGITYLAPAPTPHTNHHTTTPAVIYATYSPIIPPSFLPYPESPAPQRHYPDNTLATHPPHPSDSNHHNHTPTPTLDRLVYLWHAIHPTTTHPDPHNPPHPYPLDVIAHREHTRRTLLDIFPPTNATPPSIIECTPITQPHPATSTLAATPRHITYRPPSKTFASLLAHNIPYPPPTAAAAARHAMPTTAAQPTTPTPALVTLLDGMASILPLDPLAQLLPTLPQGSTLAISFRNTDTHPLPHPLDTPNDYNNPRDFMRHPALSNVFQHTHPKDPYLLLTATINDMI